MEKTIQSGIPPTEGESTNRLCLDRPKNIFKQVLTPQWINLTKVNIYKPNKSTNLISNGDCICSKTDESSWRGERVHPKTHHYGS